MSQQEEKHEVHIYYCEDCNFSPAAIELAEELKEALGIEANMVPDKDGIFDVLVDGYLVFSMSESQRFPEPGEIVAMFLQ